MTAILEKLRAFSARQKAAYEADPLFHDNEVQANKLIGFVLASSGVVLALVFFASRVGVFTFAKDLMTPAVWQGLIEIAALCFAARVVRDDAWWLKYLLMVGSAVVYARMDMLLTHKAALLMAIPVVCSCRYCSRRLTVCMAVLTTALFALSAAAGAEYGLFNLNDLTLPVGTTMTTTGKFIDSAVEQVGYDKALFLRNTMVYSFLPKWLIFSVIATVSAKIARRGREMVLGQKRMTEETARIGTELSLATNIQAAMMPHTFPPFPDRKEFDLFAVMDPAREVGGDFYDFFLIDGDHLGLVMADVSGKGVPAALFMMACKIILQSVAMLGKTPAEVLQKTNEAICSNNEAEMFVTVWFGILEISTGKLTAANAGHEYPVLKRPDGGFGLYKDRHGFVLGGLESVRYREYEIQLEPGSKLFLYTDGLTEANDESQALFGTERMLAALNEAKDAEPKEILTNVRRAVDAFAGQAEQFDDLTMLCLEYRGS